jgi:protein TonB
MSDNYIEKTFLYFIFLSIVVHAAGLYLLMLAPEKKQEPKQEAYMVDLTDIPDLPSAQSRPKVKRYAEKRRRVARETAPKGEMPREKTASIPRSTPGRDAARAPREARVPERKPEPSSRTEQMKEPGKSGTEGKPTVKRLPELSKLYPSPSRLAKLEEGYRKKYGDDVEEGDTRFLNSDDIFFGSFLRRFESAVYGVWRYPEAAARAGIQGVTPVKITFNRKGEIEKIDLLESSGSQLLDSEVFRTLKALGPIGGFPKAYNKEQFHLIAFFQYGLIQGAGRGRLH